MSHVTLDLLEATRCHVVMSHGRDENCGKDDKELNIGGARS
jgi:hypothetical protein